jgi:ABC-2 type transport system permease protein
MSDVSIENTAVESTESTGKNKSKKTSAWVVIMKRELGAYFTSPVAYIVCGLFLIFTGCFFFSTFFLAKRAELRNFFSLLPITFSFFIPALTMRIFSEEKRSGSIETLVTLPVTSLDIVAGKYVASLISSVVLLVPTLFYVITCAIFGNPDAGPIVGGYIGAILLAASFCAIGVFASSVTKNQILSFFIGIAICIFLCMISAFVQLMPAALASFVTFFSATSHFDSISRGIIDTRDVLYFVSLIALFFVLTVQVVQNARKG